MNYLKPAQGRRRGLSVNSISDAQQRAMNNSLDNLQNDLSHVEAQWNRVLTEKSNPLELALSFLDDTSVGLGHRYQDFKQLKTRIGYDLQEAVNEHFQVLNSNVASYSIAVDSITSAQDNINQLKEHVNESINNITMKKGSLKELNNSAMEQNEIISILSAIEDLLKLPEKVEEHIRNADYREAQLLLARGFFSATAHKLWSLDSLQILKQQLELQEHILFNNLIEELHDIVYSKKGVQISNQSILDNIGLTQEGFTGLENYLYNVANVDLMKNSSDINAQLLNFLESVKKQNFSLSKGNIKSEEGDKFDRLFFVLSILNDINKLPTALNILTNRVKEELHTIILKSTEEIRVNHPSLIKVAGNSGAGNVFGVSMKDVLSIIIRKCFWKIFIKFLMAAQGHRVIFESANKLLPSASAPSVYKFDLFWSKLMNEIETLLSTYLESSDVSLAGGARHRSTSAASLPKTKDSQVFTLQHNVEDSSTARTHANELKALLKDIFPGITISASTELESIYVEEECFEQEESLIPPSIFNMKILLEPYLLFCQATSDIIPIEMRNRTVSSITFFSSFMDNRFFPRLELTLAYLFEREVESNNPYALENLEENKYVFKAAVDFRSLLHKLLHIMNTTHRFRSKIFGAIMELLRRFYMYYFNLFEGLFGTTSSSVQKRIISVWITDNDIMKIEKDFLEGDDSSLANEAALLIQHCPDFLKKEKRVRREDAFNTVTLDAVTHFLGTVVWILSWLPDLKRLIRSDCKNTEEINVDKLRANWSFSESDDLTNIDRTDTVKILMDSEAAGSFDEVVDGFTSLKSKLFSAIRFDSRARCMYHISGLFQATDLWDSDIGSIELNENVSSLITELKTIENKVRQQLSEDDITNVFLGIDTFNNRLFITGMHSIPVMNKNGVKKMLRNIKVLQNTFKNLVSEPSKVDMGEVLKLYSLCGSDEFDLFQQIEEGHLVCCSKDDLRNILRLQFSEQLQRQVKRNSTNQKRINSMPLNKRYNDAMKRLASLLDHK